MRLLLLPLLAFLGCSHSKIEKQEEKDPLPSWSNTRIKQSIIGYVEKITAKNSDDFIPVEDRIATFDNDGTLWAETPPNQILFAENEATEKRIQHRPLHVMNEKEISKLIMKTHAGMSTETFTKEVEDFLSTAVHPTLQVPYSQTIYVPQIELIGYLKDHGFKVYICAGGTAEFMRAISNDLYGIPVEQVMGTNFSYRWNDSNNSLVMRPEVQILNDRAEKPASIQRVIGKRPVFASGNVKNGGDIYMLRYSQGGKYPSFQLLINHDDAKREFAYQEADNISLTWARRYGWNILSMKDDWVKIFPFQNAIQKQEAPKKMSPIDDWLHE